MTNDEILGEHFANTVRAGFNGYSDEHFLIGLLKGASNDLDGRIFGDQALARVHAIIGIYDEVREARRAAAAEDPVGAL